MNESLKVYAGFWELNYLVCVTTLNDALKRLPNVPNLTKSLMDHNLTPKEYLAQNLEDSTPLCCDVCGVYDEEVATCNATLIDAICPSCAKGQGLFYCEGCDNYSAVYGPGKEECLSCYERSIDAAHDRMKEF